MTTFKTSSDSLPSSLKITKTVVDKLPIPDDGQTFTRDTELKGFAVRVTSGGAKSFILEKRVEGKVRRFTLGRYPEITVEQARREAHKLLGHIATGGNPIVEKQQEKLRATTLAEAFDDYVEVRKDIKERTLYDYRRLLFVAFEDWCAKPITEINKEMVAKRHTKLGEERGEAYANLAMRFLRALFNFAVVQYEDQKGNPLIRENPVTRLTQTRAWYKVDSRKSVIRPDQLAPWYQAIQNLRLEPNNRTSHVVADYLLFLLFTGLRRREGSGLKWENVDLVNRTLTITDTKNSDQLVLPITDAIAGILESRREVAWNPYVFPGEGIQGYIVEPRKQTAKVIAESGITFTLHDLRRTFITVAESLDISAYALKRLVNHRVSNDVTAGYIISDVERLRKPMETISAYLCEKCGIQP